MAAVLVFNHFRGDKCDNIDRLESFCKPSFTLEQLDSLPRCDTTILKIPSMSVDSVLIYVLHSDCSVCLGSFIGFFNTYMVSGITLPIIVDIASGDGVRLDYAIGDLYRDDRDRLSEARLAISHVVEQPPISPYIEDGLYLAIHNRLAAHIRY